MLSKLRKRRHSSSLSLFFNARKNAIAREPSKKTCADSYLGRRLKPTLLKPSQELLRRIAQQDHIRHCVALQYAELFAVEREVVGVD